MTLAFETARQLAQKIRAREISSRELTDLYIQRIEKHDPAVNAVVVRDFERAREAAAAADEALARGDEVGPLHGLPMTIKEAYDVEGLPTTWGIPAFKDNIATGAAESVKRYRSAGAHFLGKTNVPLQLGDFQSYNEIYGTTSNPWNLERTPGGSSGGSSAALAAGLAPLESGSDIGGSIRNPAHFCGVYGHKPTHGIVPDQGHALPGMVASPDIAVVGPLARSAEDLALAMELLAGADPFHELGWRLALPAPRHRELADFRVALWPTEARAPVSSEVADRVQQLGDRLAGLGATVSDVARPAFDVETSHATYLTMLNGVMSAGLPDDIFEGMQHGARSLDAGDESDDARMLRAAVQTHRDWVRAGHVRARLRLAWKAFFEDFDIVLCPQMATAAFPHDHSPFLSRTLQIDDTVRPYFEQVFWAGLPTVSYLPSTVFPTGPSKEGLPIGLQAVGAEFDDATCIEFARLIALEIGGFVPPPGYED
ncbi:MAG: amidase [Deltaproteobacteria bacterium]|nr:amidase [Deltaproteobacteria bacterium]